MDLSQYDAKRFAVVWKIGNAVRVFRGAARYEADSSRGAVLRIGPAPGDPVSPGDPVLVLHEDSWGGRIRGDDRYGCEFRLDFDLSQPAPAFVPAVG